MSDLYYNNLTEAVTDLRPLMSPGLKAHLEQYIKDDDMDAAWAIINNLKATANALENIMGVLGAGI